MSISLVSRVIYPTISCAPIAFSISFSTRIAAIKVEVRVLSSFLGAWHSLASIRVARFTRYARTCQLTSRTWLNSALCVVLWRRMSLRARSPLSRTYMYICIVYTIYSILYSIRNGLARSIDLQIYTSVSSNFFCSSSSSHLLGCLDCHGWERRAVFGPVFPWHWPLRILSLCIPCTTFLPLALQLLLQVERCH